MSSMRALPLLSVLACAPVEPEGLDVLAPPSFALLLGGSGSQAYAFRGETMTIRFAGAPSGKTVGIVGGLSVGGRLSCPRELAPTCLSLSEPATLLGTARAGPNGGGSLDVVVPHKSRFPEVFLQAAYGLPGGGVVTAAVSSRILERTGDEDRDGLLNLDERTLGTDPFLPDSDGDGFFDGAEVRCGSSPRDPAETC